MPLLHPLDARWLCTPREDIGWRAAMSISGDVWFYCTVDEGLENPQKNRAALPSSRGFHTAAGSTAGMAYAYFL
jgi:hypothetical protein